MNPLKMTGPPTVSTNTASPPLKPNSSSDREKTLFKEKIGAGTINNTWGRGGGIKIKATQRVSLQTKLQGLNEKPLPSGPNQGQVHC